LRLQRPEIVLLIVGSAAVALGSYLATGKVVALVGGFGVGFVISAGLAIEWSLTRPARARANLDNAARYAREGLSFVRGRVLLALALDLVVFFQLIALGVAYGDLSRFALLAVAICLPVAVLLPIFARLWIRNHQ
jgi:hypothetical protein